jgi:hypothetical protein
MSREPLRAHRKGAVETSHNAEALWDTFVAAQERSKRTLSLADGIAAGKAYAAFLQAFCSTEGSGQSEKGGGQ